MPDIRFIFGVFLIACLGAVPAIADDDDNPKPPPATAPAPVPAACDGNYTISLAGNYGGKGTLKINNAKLQIIQCQLTTPDGTTYNFHTQQPLNISKGYFNGNAKMGDLDVTIQGRIDYPAPDENYPARIIATFRVEDGHGGRFVGKLAP